MRSVDMIVGAAGWVGSWLLHKNQDNEICVLSEAYFFSVSLPFSFAVKNSPMLWYLRSVTSVSTGRGGFACPDALSKVGPECGRRAIRGSLHVEQD